VKFSLDLGGDKVKLYLFYLVKEGKEAAQPAVSYYVWSCITLKSLEHWGFGSPGWWVYLLSCLSRVALRVELFSLGWETCDICWDCGCSMQLNC